ncbi:hypothetical protein [uncultured Corynebacterium sp.]|uniref:hypothetical protein n=1 Tax=uncultured Corynebacterium sp. TaxID=159447 RepID=UPI0025DDFD46|nr:hypothetical protein [uncultured Corynebacterium sp.]
MSEQNTSENTANAQTEGTETTADNADSGEKQAELGDAGKKALDSERTARKDAEKQAKAAAARVAEVEAELEKARAAADEAAKAKSALEHENTVREVIAEAGLPAEVAAFLGEGDRDALVERAEAFKEIAEAMFAARRPQPVPEVGQVNIPRRSTGDQFAQAIEPLLNR